PRPYWVSTRCEAARHAAQQSAHTPSSTRFPIAPPMGAASSAGFSSSQREHTTVVAMAAPLSHAATHQNLGHRRAARLVGDIDTEAPRRAEPASWPKTPLPARLHARHI